MMPRPNEVGRTIRLLPPVMGTLAFILGTVPAQAKPRLVERDFEAASAVPCTGTYKTWSLARDCLDKVRGQHARVLHDGDLLKIVELPGPDPMHAIAVYLRGDAGWTQSFVRDHTQEQVLGVAPFAGAARSMFRIDLGNAARTLAGAFDGVASEPAIVRRVQAVVCGGGRCHEISTLCEVYTRGVLVAAFHGELVWHATLGLRLRGDVRQAGPHCTPPRFQLLDDAP